MRMTLGRCLVGTLLVAATGFIHSPGVGVGVRVAPVAPVAPSRATVDVPAWLYPSQAPTAAHAWDSVTRLRVPRSRASFPEHRLHDLFFAPDWNAESHPAMPAVVARGRKPDLYACGYCHMPDGTGRPENVALAGLPVAYIVQQVADMKSHTRRSAWPNAWVPSDNMQIVAKHATDEDVRIAAEYFSRLRPRQRTRIVETAVIPRVRMAVGLYVREPGAATEPLAGRLIEVPDDDIRHERRDPWIGYTAYVPPGSIARGRDRSRTPVAPGLLACVGCHGPALRGAGFIPPLAGRSPGYLVRQMLAFKSGTRATAAGLPMQGVAAALSLDDMIALAAYAATLKP